MYSKRVFTLLTTLFIAFVLTACGGGGGYGDNGGSTTSGKKNLTSVREFDYFPRFNEVADNITHIIQRSYKSEAERSDDVNAFKDKGNYRTSQGIIFRDNPYGIVRKAYMSPSTSCLQGVLCPITMVLEIPLGDLIDRNNTLFENIFGYEEGTLVSILVRKFFERDITPQLKEYGALLEKNYGFKKVSARQWMKDDLKDSGVTYTFLYTEAIYDYDYNPVRISQLVEWHVSATNVPGL
jgi:hypothetical protein